MRVLVSNPALLHDLRDFLERAECVALQAGADVLDVNVPRAPSDKQARRELAIYLATWMARYPGERATVTD